MADSSWSTFSLTWLNPSLQGLRCVVIHLDVLASVLRSLCLVELRAVSSPSEGRILASSGSWHRKA